MKELLRKLMLDTVVKLRDSGYSEEEAVDMVIGLVNLNKDSVNDIMYMKTLLNNLVEIS